MIKASIIADSISPQNIRITTFILTVPQIIVKELLRHRVFSFSSSSMRAIPFTKVITDIKENMFIPLAFQRHHSGMQGLEYLNTEEYENAKQEWIKSGLQACDKAEKLYKTGVTKQICSRIIETFGYAKILVTATEFDNFYELRCPKIYHAATGKYYKSVKDWNNIDSEIQYDGLSCLHPENISQAEIHIQALAEAMWDTRNESTPNQLKAGEWHIPFGDKFDSDEGKFVKYLESIWKNKQAPTNGNINERVKIATARCARLSYMTFDKEIDYEKDIKLHDQLLESKHYSPFEHCCRVMNDEEYETFVKGRLDRLGEFIEKYEEGYLENLFVPDQIQGWCNNVKGFIQYRYLLENGNS